MQKRPPATFIATFLLPAVLLYGLFVVYPLAQAMVFSFYRWRGVSEQKTFVGLENFRNLFSDTVFWGALEHNLLLLALAGAAILALAMGIAHALQLHNRATGLLRSVYLFPQVMSLVVVSILWMFIYNPSFGLLNGTLRAVGLGHLATGWLGNSTMALAAVGATYVWHALGFYIMLFSAGLQTTPVEVYEAARLDGAEGLTRLRTITLPLIWAILRVAVIYLVINTLNIFALVFLMTQGGPDRHTEVMLTYMYEQAFTNNDFGLATALAVANLGIVMGLSGLTLLLFRRDPREGKA